MENTRYKILLIEDDELDRMAFKRFVDGNAIPYDCTVSGSVSQARQALKSNQFDSLLIIHSGTERHLISWSLPRIRVTVVTEPAMRNGSQNMESRRYDYLVKI
jgi:CheY-like chemotaxis protein